MDFWTRVDDEVNRQKTSYRWLAQMIDSPETSLSGWRRLGRLPRVDKAVEIAKALKVSVEYLVTGVQPHTVEVPATWTPMDKFALIIKDIQILDDDGLKAVAKLAKSYADDVRSKQASIGGG